VAAGAQPGWGAAGAPAPPLRHLSILLTSSLPSVPVPGGTVNFTAINPRKTATNIVGMVPPCALGPSQQQKPDPPAPYNLSIPADAPHARWHLTIHPTSKITNQYQISLPLPLPPPGRAKKAAPDQCRGLSSCGAGA